MLAPPRFSFLIFLLFVVYAWFTRNRINVQNRRLVELCTQEICTFCSVAIPVSTIYYDTTHEYYNIIIVLAYFNNTLIGEGGGGAYAREEKNSETRRFCEAFAIFVFLVSKPTATCKRVIFSSLRVGIPTHLPCKIHVGSHVLVGFITARVHNI